MIPSINERNQLLNKEHYTLYVELMCEYEPGGVLPFLQRYDHLIDVEKCQEYCNMNKIKDAAAYLLEREGDIRGSLLLYIDEIKE